MQGFVSQALPRFAKSAAVQMNLLLAGCEGSSFDDKSLVVVQGLS
jgi:hypothetical protein